MHSPCARLANHEQFDDRRGKGGIQCVLLLSHPFARVLGKSHCASIALALPLHIQLALGEFGLLFRLGSGNTLAAHDCDIVDFQNP